MSKDPIEFIEKLLSEYNKEYKERLEILYKDAYLENPEAFPLANISDIDAYIIKGDKRFLTYSYHVFLYQGNGKIENFGEIPNEDYSKLKDFQSNEGFLLDTINNLTGVDKKAYFYIYELEAYLNSYNDHLYKTPEDYIEIQKENIANQMLRKLKEDGSQFINHINKESSYYAKNAFRYAYSELDFSAIITAIEDQDFEYALNESIACYDQSLYLAAVSTAGTALENLIIKILENEGKFPENKTTTELGELSGILRGAGLINRRDRSRIMLAASFRNLASHANKGRVTRQDAKVVYQEIFNLASNLFDI